MRTRVELALALLSLLLQSGMGLGTTDQATEPNKFFREYVGLNDDQIAAIRQGKAIAKSVESRTPDEIFVFGSVYIDATPESYLKLASNIDARR